MAKGGAQGRGKLDMNRFLVQVLMLMQKYRPGEITFARVARHCRVPRSTLYYYFGPSRVAMVDEAIRFGMTRFVQLSGSRDYTKFATFDEFESKRMRRSLRIMAKYPWVADLYFRYRAESGKFGESIRMIEERYFALYSEAWKHFHGVPSDIHGLRMATYMKIGTFYGYGVDRDLWRTPRGKVIREYALEAFEKLTCHLMAGNVKLPEADVSASAPARRSRPGLPVPAPRSHRELDSPRTGRQ